MPAQIDGANGTGIGTQAPTEKYGVMSPFHAGGGGGGGGGGGAGAATQLFDGASNTVPYPHSTAPLTPGDAIVANAKGASAAAPTIATRRNVLDIEGLPRSRPRPSIPQILDPPRARKKS
jgi:hypothetical protein